MTTEPITIELATLDDLSYLMSLMRANRESVGGLPAPAIEERVERGTVLMATLNGEPCGYLLYDQRDGVVRIPQACIQYDARRRQYGIALVRALLDRCTDTKEIVLRCAADLEANLFWREMGFTCVGTAAGGRRRGRTINVWVLEPRLLTADQIAVPPAAELRQDCMYDESEFLTAAPEGFQSGRTSQTRLVEPQVTNEPITVELPVCPFPGCGHVGKQPMQAKMSRGTRYSCTGPSQHDHKRETMVWRRFVMVEEE